MSVAKSFSVIAVCATTAILSAASLGAAEKPTPAEDAAKLAGKKAAMWTSATMKLRYNNGKTGEGALAMEFVPADTVTHEEIDDIVAERLKKIAKLPKPAKPMDAKVRLWLKHRSETIPGGESSISASGWLEVRLAEGDSDRTLKLTKSLETVSGPDEGTQRRLERDSIVYNYEMRGDKFVLKSIPASIIRWGQLEFAVPTGEVEFVETKK